MKLLIIMQVRFLPLLLKNKVMKKKNDSYGRMEEDLTVKEFFISFLIWILFIGLMFCLFNQISKVVECRHKKLQSGERTLTLNKKLSAQECGSYAGSIPALAAFCTQVILNHFVDVNKMIKTKANESRTFRHIWQR